MRSRLSPADRKLTANLYSIYRDQMNAGIYSPNRASFLCSREYCGFADRCEADFRGKVGD
jgi:hypothetical protein